MPEKVTTVKTRSAHEYWRNAEKTPRRTPSTTLMNRAIPISSSEFGMCVARIEVTGRSVMIDAPKLPCTTCPSHVR